MKTLKEFLGESKKHDLEVKMNKGGLTYKVHKIHNDGIAPDQLKVGQDLKDHEIDAIHDAGLKIKFHKEDK